jgi:hypothetical protein
VDGTATNDANAVQAIVTLAISIFMTASTSGRRTRYGGRRRQYFTARRPAMLRAAESTDTATPTPPP